MSRERGRVAIAQSKSFNRGRAAMPPLFPPRLTAALLLYLLVIPVGPSTPAPHGPRLPGHDRRAAQGGRFIFVLAGQSNMSGRGGVVNNTWDGVVPPECGPDPSIQRLSAALRWEEAREPLHADIDVYAVCGVGPGMSFANAIRRGASRPAAVGLVPCAVGATRIEQWGKGKQLYEQMVRRAKAAAGDGEGRIAAVLWYQGESDAILRADAEAYRGKMERMALDLRADLGIPRLPVIQVLLASGQGPYVDLVREAQRAVTLPNVAWVDAKGLPLSDDHVHLTTSGEVRLGEMLAAAYSKFSHVESDRFSHVGSESP